MFFYSCVRFTGLVGTQSVSHVGHERGMLGQVWGSGVKVPQ